MRRSAVLLALAALAAACAAPGTPGTSGTRPSNVAITPDGAGGGDINFALSEDNAATATKVDAPPQRVWGMLRQAYLQVGIPVTLEDSANYTMGNVRLQPGRRIGNTPLSNFVNCGNDNVGRPLADSYRITMNVRTMLVPAATGTEMRTTVSGDARSISGASNTPVRCASTGVLEGRIAGATLAQTLRTGS